MRVNKVLVMTDYFLLYAPEYVSGNGQRLTVKTNFIGEQVKWPYSLY